MSVAGNWAYNQDTDGSPGATRTRVVHKDRNGSRQAWVITLKCSLIAGYRKKSLPFPEISIL